MRIFYAFLVILTAAMLWMIPVTSAIYDFRTDVGEDSFTSTTAVGQTTDNVTLSEVLYGNDTSTIDVLSSISDDSPLFASYNSTTRLLGISDLGEDTTRTLTVSYDVDALGGSDAINTLANAVPWIWLLCIVAFPMAAIASMFVGRNR